MKKALLFKKLENKLAQCQNCSHYCILKNNEVGKCGVRQNINGEIYSLVYRKICALHIDPIEKKPLFHFLPGTYSLSIATVGCPFGCLNCQNWQISQAPKLWGKIEGKDFSPQEIVKIAQEQQTPSISYTYTDPIVFSEYALEIMKLAKTKNIKNNWISNGFWSKELLQEISPYLDAVNIDLKSFSDNFYQKYCNGKLQPVLDTLRNLKKKNIWIEVTTLIIPTLNDNKKEITEIANFIKKELGENTPWHVTKFCASLSWKLQNLPDTPAQTLKMAHQIGKQAGLRYVYTGNIPGLDSENTYCPHCSTLAIERKNFFIHRYDKKGHCPSCGEDLNIIELQK